MRKAISLILLFVTVLFIGVKQSAGIDKNTMQQMEERYKEQIEGAEYFLRGVEKERKIKHSLVLAGACEQIGNLLSTEFGAAESVFSELSGGLGLKQSYSYRNMCITYKNLIESLTPDEERKMIVLFILAWDINPHGGNFIDSPSYIFLVNRKLNLRDFLRVKMDCKKKCPEPYLQFLSHLIVTDKENALKMIRAIPDTLIQELKDYQIETLTTLQNRRPDSYPIFFSFYDYLNSKYYWNVFIPYMAKLKFNGDQQKFQDYYDKILGQKTKEYEAKYPDDKNLSQYERFLKDNEIAKTERDFYLYYLTTGQFLKAEKLQQAEKGEN